MCYCANNYSRTPSRASDQAQSGGSNVPCAGNGAELCGGPNLLQVYQFSPISSSSSIQVPSTSSSSQTSSSAAAASPTIVPSAGNYFNQGVYADSANSPLLSNVRSKSDSSITVESCATFCAGFTYMGVENGKWILTSRSLLLEIEREY